MRKGEKVRREGGRGREGRRGREGGRNRRKRDIYLSTL